MTNTAIAEYLEGGADALASGAVKWVQGTLGSWKKGCAFGACNYARYGYVQSMPDFAPVINIAAQRRIGIGLATYNDARGRTKDQVIDMLTLLAKDFRNA